MVLLIKLSILFHKIKIVILDDIIKIKILLIKRIYIIRNSYFYIYKKSVIYTYYCLNILNQIFFIKYLKSNVHDNNLNMKIKELHHQDK